MHALDRNEHELFLEELEKLDEELIEVDGRKMKPSQCYHIGLDPIHILYNQNCPESLKDKINSILKRYRYL